VVNVADFRTPRFSHISSCVFFLIEHSGFPDFHHSHELQYGIFRVFSGMVVNLPFFITHAFFISFRIGGFGVKSLFRPIPTFQ
jgi:hypothetical protein